MQDDQRHTRLSGHAAGNPDTSTGACRLDTLILKAWIQLPRRRRSILLHLLEKKSEEYSFHIDSPLWFARPPSKASPPKCMVLSCSPFLNASLLSPSRSNV